MRNSSNLITVVGILLILGGIARCIVALASGNPEHMVLGTIVGIAYGAIAGLALRVDRFTTQPAAARRPNDPR